MWTMGIYQGIVYSWEVFSTCASDWMMLLVFHSEIDHQNWSQGEHKVFSEMFSLLLDIIFLTEAVARCIHCVTTSCVKENTIWLEFTSSSIMMNGILLHIQIASMYAHSVFKKKKKLFIKSISAAPAESQQSPVESLWHVIKKAGLKVSFF